MSIYEMVLQMLLGDFSSWREEETFHRDFVSLVLIEIEAEMAKIQEDWAKSLPSQEGLLMERRAFLLQVQEECREQIRDCTIQLNQ